MMTFTSCVRSTTILCLLAFLHNGMSIVRAEDSSCPTSGGECRDEYSCVIPHADCSCHSSCLTCGYGSHETGSDDCLTCPSNRWKDVVWEWVDGYGRRTYTGYCRLKNDDDGGSSGGSSSSSSGSSNVIVSHLITLIMLCCVGVCCYRTCCSRKKEDSSEVSPDVEMMRVQINDPTTTGHERSRPPDCPPIGTVVNATLNATQPLGLRHTLGERPTISEVRSGGQAEAAGIKVGMSVTKLNNRPVLLDTDFDVALDAVKREDETTFLLTLEVLGPVALATAATSVPGGPPTTPPPQIDVAAAAPVPLMNTAPIYDTQVVMSGSQPMQYQQQPMQYQQQPMQYRQHAPLPTFNHGFFQPPRFMCVRLDITQSFGWSMAGGQSLVVVAVQGQAAAAGVRAGWVVCSVNGSGLDSYNQFLTYVAQCAHRGETMVHFHLDTSPPNGVNKQQPPPRMQQPLQQQPQQQQPYAPQQREMEH